MAKKKKEFNEEVLNRVFNNGRCVNYRYPDELSTLIKDIDVEDRICKYKRRSGIEIDGYYAVFVDSHSGPYIRLLHVTGYEEKYGYYTGDMIAFSDISLSLSHDEIFEIDYYETVKEITRDLFYSVKKYICIMDKIVNIINRNVCWMDIDNDIYKDFHTYGMDDGVALFHKDVLDMTVREFHDMVNKHNHDVLSRIEDLNKYCDERLHDKYLLRYRVSGELEIVKVMGFHIRKTVGGQYDDITTHNFVFINKRIVTNSNGYYSLARYENTFNGFFDNGQPINVLPNELGDELFNRYDSVTSGLRSLFSNKKSADDKKGGISYDK